ncbi:glycosyltransferase family 2 protein [Gloeocapsopsis dulcis]|uniref:Glycosyl transferase family A n=1 Tax=Gloeocapsopsis dulcis AAB1 = 1H9 TaxID=1433147 RepID=A0A6N8G041_9CHRO|nr:glycosyltransferase family A protein [Gloeocapsopsis dulcis]MUL38748.1 glycosyl transferase family A [Gloeocapsopsis dulcis AAB1 = 1H9]WNN91662.1 glycosyltransferase family A protein [Gloeocapsopsis dulcis]
MSKVTIIIPAYNAMPYLQTTLASVFKQTFQDFEIIVVNDGSLDETEKYVSSLADPRLKLINQVNQGVASARNTGITHAQGEYLAFLDADDLWEPTKLETQVCCLEERFEIGLVYTWTALANQDGKSTGRLVTSHAEGEVWQQLIKFNFIGCGSTPLIRKSCFKTVGLFDSELSPAEDWDMWLKIAANYPFAVIKEPLVRYRSNSNSLSKSHLLMWKSSCKVIEKAFQSVPKDLLYLKKQAYNSLYFYLSWLATKNGDYQQALYFQKQAVAYVSQQQYAGEYLRLDLSIKLLQLLGSYRYQKLLEHLYSLRQSILDISRPFLIR